MKCSFCNKEFDEDSVLSNCRKCSLFGGCKNIKCPYCGYESPQKPDLLKWFKKLRTRKNDRP